MYDGTVEEYLYRRQQVEQGLARQEHEERPARPSDVFSAKRTKKEKRRQEALLRNERRKRAGIWLKRRDEAEKRVEEFEQLKDALEKQMADPDLYQDQEAWRQTSNAYDDCSRRLDRWLERWEEAQEKIDRIDEKLGLG
ncbi:MAG: hypothetical protein CR981_03725 [Proteobacteria bacterium]|nr:MAG: hypothetical protein CR981_03725 [Pseudomonadota bacterium]